MNSSGQLLLRVRKAMLSSGIHNYCWRKQKVKSRWKDRKPATEPTLSQRSGRNQRTRKLNKKRKDGSKPTTPNPERPKKSHPRGRKPNPGLHTDVIPENNICRPVFHPPPPLGLPDQNLKTSVFKSLPSGKQQRIALPDTDTRTHRGSKPGARAGRINFHKSNDD